MFKVSPIGLGEPIQLVPWCFDHLGKLSCFFLYELMFQAGPVYFWPPTAWYLFSPQGRWFLVVGNGV